MKIDRRRFLASLSGAAAAPALRLGASAQALPQAVSPSRLASDPRRPQYHLLPPANWMNDPNAPIYWNGNYHMFYQYNPDGAYWGDMHWGHAVSPDMVHWRHLPVALSPTPGGPDAQGCFTGTAAVDDGRVAILYTGVCAAPLREATSKDSAHPLRESQCLVVAADPDLKTWIKTAAPVIAAPPPGLAVNGFRDPSPWRQGDWWYLVAASGIANQGGAVLLYRSKYLPGNLSENLHSWEYMHILSGRGRAGAGSSDPSDRFDPFDPWEVWECPEFFALGDWHVLIFSTAGKTYWQSGRLDAETMIFHPAQSGLADYGSFYAAKTQLDKDGNRILWGWIQEARPLAEYKAAGWAGLMSLPRVLTVADDGRLRFSVSPAVKQLRRREQKLSVTHDDESNRRQIAAMQVENCCGEILCRLRASSGPFRLILSGSDKDAAVWLMLEWDHEDAANRNSSPDNSTLNNSSAGNSTPVGHLSIDGHPLPPLDSLNSGEDSDFELRIYVDGSVLEIFIRDQLAWTKRFYPAGSAAQNLRLQWTGRTTTIEQLSVWQLAPISPDRLTA
ncbi:MAG TPA: glycoside hydrolase family 32 protein [Terracidiphilus sp.]|jgi:beta-fructofuranosidase|nr:glycoside hydrolase family 32 protein [Terracidiphilus sp.]